ncbi:MAG: hypothetical protein DMF98_24105 [Acidobacteria bacterium]|nr:MAG: hypothetical protein DMF98_24105 [Acidobacteriota bacterium]
MVITSLPHLGVLLGVAVGIRISRQRIAGGKRLLDRFVESGFSAKPFPLWRMPVQSGACLNRHTGLDNIF